MEEIRNKVKESGLISMDLAMFKPDKSQLIGIDIADQLWERLILKEKMFREYIDSNDWFQYKDKYVHIFCSEDAIVPTWAYMLVSSKLVNIAHLVIVGSQVDLQKKIVSDKIQALDLSEFKDGRIIIKGCADIVEPEFAMSQLIQKLQPVAKSIMYGEPCSTVPIFKRKQ
jgi:predicted transcriptional regulator